MGVIEEKKLLLWNDVYFGLRFVFLSLPNNFLLIKVLIFNFVGPYVFVFHLFCVFCLTKFIFVVGATSSLQIVLVVP